VQAQRAQSQQELEQLKGLLHPIRRCPSDVLQYIFESAVSMDEDDSNQSAESISKVCRRWREAALRTPFLWSKICISVNSDPSRADLFYKQMLARARPLRARLIFKGFAEKNDREIQIARLCELDQLSHVKLLQFNFEKSSGAVSLLSDSIEVSTCKLDELALVGSRSLAKSKDFPGLAHIMRKFNIASSLRVDSLPALPRVSYGRADHIVNLRLQRSPSVSLSGLVDMFPNVQCATFDESSLRHDNGVVVWPSVRSLTIQHHNPTFIRNLVV
jgi:hypothetical protein